MEEKKTLPLLAAMAAMFSYEEHLDEIQSTLLKVKLNPNDEKLRSLLSLKMQLFIFKDLQDKQGYSNPLDAYKNASDVVEVSEMASKILNNKN